MKKGNTYTRKLSEQQKLDAVAAYEAGQSMRTIAATHGVDTSSIFSLLQRRGVKSRSHSEANRKHAVDEAAFDAVTPESAYWIGFLMADGCVKQQPTGAYIYLSLQVGDIDHIGKFLAFLKAAHPITLTRCGKYARTCIGSLRLAGALAPFGVVPRKSKTARVIGLENDRHFWRGVVDGDGHVFVCGKGRIHVGAVGSLDLMTQFASFVKTVVPTYQGGVVPMSGIFSVRLSGNGAIALLREMYLPGETWLERKRAAALDCIALHEKRHADKKARQTCTIEGCGKRVEAKGFCLAHYKRNYKHGSPHLVATRWHGPAQAVD